MGIGHVVRGSLLTLGLSAGSVVIATPAKSAAALKARTDVGAAFGEAACAGTLTESPLKAWGAGVYDAQIEGRKLEGLGGKLATPEAAERRARSLARVRRYLGYAHGM